MRGHPWIVANKGRLGFRRRRPRTPTRPRPASRFALLWLRGRRRRATRRGLDHATCREQVGDGLALRPPPTRTRPDASYLPVHPWQWANRIRPLHAGEIARGQIVLLGELGGRYLPQQSIRTLADADHPERRHVKLALSILNTCVYRGLPARPHARRAGADAVAARALRGRPVPARERAWCCSARSRASASPTRRSSRSRTCPTSTPSCSARSGASRSRATCATASGRSRWRRCCTATRRAWRSSSR